MNTFNRALSRPVKLPVPAFGMEVSASEGCCVNKIKTRRTTGCCKNVPYDEFVANYRAAVREEEKRTGVKPKLDPEVEAILEGTAPPATSSAAAPAPTSQPEIPRARVDAIDIRQETPTEKRSWAKRIGEGILWPFRQIGRLLKYLVIGMWKDAKETATGKPVA